LYKKKKKKKKKKNKNKKQKTKKTRNKKGYTNLLAVSLGDRRGHLLFEF
jgi:hypothetical protein